MRSLDSSLDAVIIGGGFYGAVIATYLVRQRGLARVALLEREPELFLRASFRNQARVHNGYHYPRSFTTAYRSRVNLPRFVRDWPEAIVKDFTKLYAIARRNSKITARQFERFCIGIGADIEVADASTRQLFDSRLIEEVFRVQEYALDADRLAAWARCALRECDVDVHMQTEAVAIDANTDNRLTVRALAGGHEPRSLHAHYVFNCTYSGTNRIGGDFPGTQTRLKHEITEICLMAPPEPLRHVGVTVMDGPFFSFMPFPSRSLHSLSHVRYTPHLHWEDDSDIDPYARLASYACQTRVERMQRDASRYVPALTQAKPVESLFEVKTVLTKNESDDGRPILCERHPELPGCFSVLGGKLDNIYDVLEKLDSELLPNAARRSGRATHSPRGVA